MKLSSFKCRPLARPLALAALTLTALLGTDVGTALAQSASCSRLNAQLQTLSRNSDFRNAGQSSDDLRAVQANTRNTESAYIRSGCQRAQQQGLPQSPQCRGLAREILAQRAQIANLGQAVSNGNAVSQRREQILQEIARFGCNQQGSSARFNDAGSPPPRQRSFLDRLFGGPGDAGSDPYGDAGQYDYGGQVEDPYANMGAAGNTIRTVCVRLSDGYYWPISFATTQDYIAQDAQTCQSECPDQQVDLYYYGNPGQEPEQMINATGQPYTALASAFAYRKQIDPANTCKPKQTLGEVTVASLGDGGSRAMINYEGDSFPLPLRDPRAQAAATVVATARGTSLNIPLPRPRPSAAETAPAVVPTAAPVVSARDRIVKVGNKVVRVVGPDTPYAPATIAGPAG